MVLRPARRSARFSAAALAALTLSACGSTDGIFRKAGLGDDEYLNAVEAYSGPSDDKGLDPIAAAAFWGTRYNTDQNDPEVAVQFSNALRKISSIDEALKVSAKANQNSPNNADVSLEYGKTLVEAGRGFEAVRHLEDAIAKKFQDWSAYSAYGVALDQIGQHDEARLQYDRALGLNPGNVSVLNNKALSFALDGRLQDATQLLREASGRAGGDARVRQNLALVYAISGNNLAAERLARADLPPRVAENKIAFFQSLMRQPTYWGEYEGDFNTPNFDAGPSTPSKAPVQPIKPTPLPEPRLKDAPAKDEPQDLTPVAAAQSPTNAGFSGDGAPIKSDK